MMTILKTVSIACFTVFAAAFAFSYMQRYFDACINIIKKRMPEIIASYLFRRKLRKIELQLVDAVQMLANALRAGLGLQQAFQMAAQDCPAPINSCFAFVMEEVKVGKSFDEALLNLKDLLPMEDVAILAESILVLKQTGGNLIETFFSISTTIRERQRIRSKIKVITTEGVVQAVTIVILPFCLAGALFVLAGWYIRPMFTTYGGALLVTFMLMLQVTGIIWIKSILRIRI